MIENIYNNIMLKYIKIKSYLQAPLLHFIYINKFSIFISRFELENYIDLLLKVRKSGTLTETGNIELDATYRNLNCNLLTDSQILSLVLYEIEKKYHFSGDGVWNKTDCKSAHTQVKQNVVN